MKNHLRIVACVVLTLARALGAAQEPATSEVPRTVEVTPKEVTAEVGQKLTFKAVAKNAAGEVIPGTPSLWFTAPFDLAAAEKGVVTVYQPGEIRVGAVINGKTGYAKISVSPAAPATVDIATPKALVAGSSSSRDREMREGILKTHYHLISRRRPSRASQGAW
jgi:hypothetical protein